MKNTTTSNNNNSQTLKPQFNVFRKLIVIHDLKNCKIEDLKDIAVLRHDFTNYPKFMEKEYSNTREYKVFEQVVNERPEGLNKEQWRDQAILSLRSLVHQDILSKYIPILYNQIAEKSNPLNSEIRKLKARVSKTEILNKKLEDTLDSKVTIATSKLQAELDQHKSDMAQYHIMYENDIAELNIKLVDVDQVMAAFKDQVNEDCLVQLGELKGQIIDLKNQLEDYENLKSLVEPLNSELQEQAEKHDAAIAEIKSEHSTAIAEIKSEHSTAIAEIKSEHSTAISNLESKIDQINSEHSTAISNLESKIDQINSFNPEELNAMVSNKTTAVEFKRKVTKAIFKMVEPEYESLLLFSNRNLPDYKQRRSNLIKLVNNLMSKIVQCRSYINVDVQVYQLKGYQKFLTEKPKKGGFN